jgi:PAS domain S-box-containing protein
MAEESIKLQSRILDSMAEGVCVTDEEGTILYTNPAEENIFGYKRGELIGKKVSVLNNYSEDQQEVIFQKIQEKIKLKNNWIGELNNIRKNRAPFTTYSRISSLTINKNKYYVYLQEDITDSKVHHKNQKLLDKVSIILSSSLDYKVTIRRVANLIVPTIADWCIIDLVNSKGKISRVEVAHANPLMKNAAFLIRKFPPQQKFYDSPASRVLFSGQPYMIPVTCKEDIERMAQNEEHKKIIELINPRSIISVPLKIREKILGSLTLGVSDSQKIYSEKDLNFAVELGRRVSFAIENALLYKNAEEALTNNRQSLRNLALAKEELSRINEELSYKNNELIKINNDLDNFIYTASHDLKAPISNLEGLVAILSEDMITEEGKEILPMIHTSLLRLRNVIKDLTEISKIQKNIEEDKEHISFSEITQEIKLLVEDEIRPNNAILDIDFSEAPEIYFSRKNLRSIIYNLISNGIKYRSLERDPVLKIRSHMTPDELILTFEDNGLGIEENDKEKIFNMFKRLHDHVEGTGIGLYIVKRIVENEGGKIEVQSQVGKGSLFSIWLPHFNPKTQ